MTSPWQRADSFLDEKSRNKNKKIQNYEYIGKLINGLEIKLSKYKLSI